MCISAQKTAPVEKFTRRRKPVFSRDQTPGSKRGNIFIDMYIHPPRHIVWSTDTLDPSDPFQKRWLLRQTLMHGRAEDVRALSLADIEKELDDLDLPEEIESLWRRYLEYSHAKSKPN